MTILFGHDSSLSAVIQEKQGYNGLQMPRYNHSHRKGEGYKFLEFVLNDKDLKSEIISLRKKWDIVPDWIVDKSDPDKRDIEYWIYDDEFEADILEVIKRRNIPLKWMKALAVYVVDDGHSGNDLNSEDGGVFMTPEGNDWFTISIGPQATFTDLTNAWNSILEFRDQPVRKDRETKNAGRDLHIFHLSKKGISAKEIQTFILNERNEKVSISTIYKVISQKKKLYKLR